MIRFAAVSYDAAALEPLHWKWGRPTAIAGTTMHGTSVSWSLLCDHTADIIADATTHAAPLPEVSPKPCSRIRFCEE